MTDAGGKPKVLRVEFFGPSGAGKSTLVRKLLANASLFSEEGIALREGRDLWKEIVRQRSAELIAVRGPKSWLKRRLLSAGYPWGNPILVADRLTRSSPELLESFNTLLSAYEGRPHGISSSAFWVNRLREEYATVECERYWRQHIAKHGRYVVFHDENLVSIANYILFYAQYGDKNLREVLSALPNADLYFHFLEPLNVCKDSVKAREPEGASREAFLEYLPRKHYFSVQSENHLRALGREVVTIDRSSSVEKIAAIIIDALNSLR